MALPSTKRTQVQSFLNRIWSNQDFMATHFHPYCARSMPVERWIANTSPMPQTIVQEESDTLADIIFEAVDKSQPTAMKDDLGKRMASSQAAAARTLEELQGDLVSSYQDIDDVKKCAQTLVSKPSRSCSYPFSSCTTDNLSQESKSFTCDLNLPCATLGSGQKLCLLDLPSTLAGNLRVDKSLVVDGSVTVKGTGTAGADLVRTGSGQVCCGGVPNSTPESMRDMYNDALGVLFM